MEKIIAKNYDLMCETISEYVVNYVNKKPDSLIVFPGGDTPLGVFEKLVVAEKENRVDFSKCHFVSLDEWENLDYSVKGSCIQTLYDYLYKKININIEKQVCFFDGKNNLEEECKRVDKFVEKYGPIDIAVLGIGMNGHIGFNEPGADENLYCHVVPLDDTTTTVSVKYFGGKQMNIAHGITLGIKHFYEAKNILLMANGKHKAEIIKTVLTGPITNEVPASLFRKVNNATIYLDEEATSLINDK